MGQEREELQSQVTYLQSTISTLKLTNQRLAEELDKLQEKIRQMVQEREKLQSQVTSLQSTISS
jgi:predicted nuclease with TOPRIM domain